MPSESKRIVHSENESRDLWGWIIKNILIITTTAIALFFSFVAAANISGGYSAYENITIAYLSATAGSFVAYFVILVLPAIILSKTLLKKNSWFRWLLVIAILFVCFCIATAVLVN